MENIEVCNESIIADTISALKKCHAQIAHLINIRDGYFNDDRIYVEGLNMKLAKLLNHDFYHSETHKFGEHSILIKENITYSVDIDKYKIYGPMLSPEFDPVKVEPKYVLSKSKMREAEKHMNSTELLIRSQFLIEKPRNTVNVTISARKS